MGITDYSEWYKITHLDIERHGGIFSLINIIYKGSGMLRHQFNNSPSKAIMDSYPEYQW